MLRSFGLDGGGTVAADAAGNVYVAWHGKGPDCRRGSEAGRQVMAGTITRCRQDFAAEAPAWNQPTGACGCCGMALFATREGTLAGLYRSATENVHRDIYLLASKNNGKNFQGSLVHRWEINACPMSSMSFTESAGKTLATWETGGQVFYGGSVWRCGAEYHSPRPATPRSASIPGLAVNGRAILSWSGRKEPAGSEEDRSPGRCSTPVAMHLATKGPRPEYHLEFRCHRKPAGWDLCRLLLMASGRAQRTVTPTSFLSAPACINHHAVPTFKILQRAAAPLFVNLSSPVP